MKMCMYSYTSNLKLGIFYLIYTNELKIPLPILSYVAGGQHPVMYTLIYVNEYRYSRIQTSSPTIYATSVFSPFLQLFAVL